MEEDFLILGRERGGLGERRAEPSAHLYDSSQGEGGHLLVLLGQVDQPQEDVLQLDEEGVRVHGPVLPRPETRHHPLLGGRNKGGI